jgi:hypothetical protein
MKARYPDAVIVFDRIEIEEGEAGCILRWLHLIGILLRVAFGNNGNDYGNFTNARHRQLG